MMMLGALGSGTFAGAEAEYPMLAPENCCEPNC